MDPIAVQSLAINGTLITLCWITVIARVYVKRVLLNRWTRDDSLMLISLATFSVDIGLIMALSTIGLGQHQSELSAQAVGTILKIFWVAEHFYIITTVTLKLSIAILLLQLVIERTHRLIILYNSIIYTVCGVVFFLVIAFQCWPVSFYWDPAVPNGKCIYRPTFAALIQTNAAISLVTDGILALMPVVMFWGVQMEIKRKISVMLLLALGISTAGVNMARFKFLQGLNSLEDQTYKLYPIAITSLFEMGIGILSASLATLRPLFVVIATKLFPPATMSDDTNGVGTYESNFHKRYKASMNQDSLFSAIMVTQSTVQTSTEIVIPSFDPKSVRDEWMATLRQGEERAAKETQKFKALRIALETRVSMDAGVRGILVRHESEDLELPKYMGA